MEMRFLEAAEAFLSSGRDLLPFAPFPAATDREAYEALPDALKQEIIAEGEKYWAFLSSHSCYRFHGIQAHRKPDKL